MNDTQSLLVYNDDKVQIYVFLILNRLQPVDSVLGSATHFH